eukprot:CAMPEP_0197505438 /NCGR_PEP_ID=MMETSP1312-20131121/4182_1 /TAXON_ID=464262 /ORGANISM="Genus nov. species nov., Strain RCC2335" /LENGTH=165 /DNA_ID=CAMNT_0043052381 /DNA_START=11 /DNA_END=509 /DNA_ORIENTATION=-
MHHRWNRYATRRDVGVKGAGLLLDLPASSLLDGPRWSEPGVVQQDLELAVRAPPVDVRELGVRDLVGAALAEVKGVVARVRDGAVAELLDVALGDGGREVRDHRVVVGLQEAHKILPDLVLASPHPVEVDRAEELSGVRVEQPTVSSTDPFFTAAIQASLAASTS